MRRCVFCIGRESCRFYLLLPTFTQFSRLRRKSQGKRQGKKNPNGPPCFSEDTAGQSSGMAVAAHFRCRNWCLEHGTQGRKQGLSNSLKTMALNPSAGYFYLKRLSRASLVAQWLRICLLMQGTRVRALVWEDPTCRGAAGPVSHNY